MLKAFSIVTITALGAAVPMITFAEMENHAMGGETGAKGSVGGIKSKSVAKKSKMTHRSKLHRSMRKPMSGSGGL